MESARQRPRTPGVIFGVVALVLLIVIGLIAMTQRQTPPPTIAEFAPQAVENIEDSPQDQASQGKNGAGAPTPSPTPGQTGQGVAPIDVPRVRKCVGDPPRQTEDPQSPPCVPYWAGDNGGATWNGVTKDEIRVVVPANDKFAPYFAKHFNSRYEMYGRRITIHKTSGGSTNQEMVAAAVKTAEERRAFASTGYHADNGIEYVYFDELARRKVIGMFGRPGYHTERGMAANHPYQWTMMPGEDVMAREKARWICSSLVGKRAEFAGGSEAIKDRKFGLVYTAQPDGGSPDLSGMKATLAACGASPVVERQMVKGGMGLDQRAVQAQNVVVELQTKGVTSVICECHTESSGFDLSPQATKQGYYPEWLIGTYMYQLEDTEAQLYEPGQVIHSFGHYWWNKELAPQDTPWYWWVTEQGGTFPDSFAYYDARQLYDHMLMLVAGIQMAGPKLTPQTFAEGLQGTRFPNPGAGGPPYYQATISYAGDHSAYEDAALGYLSRNDQSNWGPPGAACMARHGVRYGAGKWPTDNGGLFERPCY